MWETIQTNRKGDVVSWKGEWQGTVMRGIVERHVVGRPAEPSTFVGVLKMTDATRSEI